MPKYSTDRYCTNNLLLINDRMSIMNCVNIPTYIFIFAFFNLLCISFFLKISHPLCQTIKLLPWVALISMDKTIFQVNYNYFCRLRRCYIPQELCFKTCFTTSRFEILYADIQWYDFLIFFIIFYLYYLLFLWLLDHWKSPQTLPVIVSPEFFSPGFLWQRP